MAEVLAVTVYFDRDSTDTGIVKRVALCYQLRSLDLLAHKAGNTAKVEPHIMDEILPVVINLIDPR